MTGLLAGKVISRSEEIVKVGAKDCQRWQIAGECGPIKPNYSSVHHLHIRCVRLA
jgi:hypothetical protein